jgi:hypothetical protein
MLASQVGAVHCLGQHQPPLLRCCPLLQMLAVACVLGQLQILLMLAQV